MNLGVQSYPLRLNMADIKNPYKGVGENILKMIKNPLNIKHKSLITICRKFSPNSAFFMLFCGSWYCGHFRITKAVKMFDGDINRLYATFRQLESYEDVLPHSSTNIFNDKVVELKQRIRRAFEGLQKNYYFYRTVNKNIDFSEYYSSFFLRWGRVGLNPLDEGNRSTLEFFFKAEGVLQVAALALLGLVELLLS